MRIAASGVPQTRSIFAIAPIMIVLAHSCLRRCRCKNQATRRAPRLPAVCCFDFFSSARRLLCLYKYGSRARGKLQGLRSGGRSPGHSASVPQCAIGFRGLPRIAAAVARGCAPARGCLAVCPGCAPPLLVTERKSTLLACAWKGKATRSAHKTGAAAPGCQDTQHMSDDNLVQKTIGSACRQAVPDNKPGSKLRNAREPRKPGGDVDVRSVLLRQGNSKALKNE